MKKFWILKGIKIAAFVILGVVAFGFVVMWLWNCLVPALFAGPVITFWQALGILVLSKILFGGFKGGGGHHRCHNCGGKGGSWKEHWKEKMQSKMASMSPEQKEKFKQRFGNRCKMWGDETPPENENTTKES